jgi:hypothetical protein
MSLDLLPKLENLGEFELSWDGIDGLTAEVLDEALAAGARTCKMIVTKTPGRHRFGIAVRGIIPGQVYRVALWLKAATESHILLDLRDGGSQHYGTVIFSLPEAALLRGTGDVIGAGFESGDDGWTRVWVDMIYAEEPGVVYVVLLDLADSPEYVGDGKAVLDFRGIEVTEVP